MALTPASELCAKKTGKKRKLHAVMACCMLIAQPQLLLVLQVTAVPLKYQVLPAAVVVAPAMPVDSQAMQLKGWEVKLKVNEPDAARAGAVAHLGV